MDAERRASIENWYDSLNEVERIALNYYLFTGDTRLLTAFNDRSHLLKRFHYLPFVDEPEQTFLCRRKL